MNKEFVTLKLKDIIPYPNNPRHNDEAVKYVVQSMKDCGNLDPIEVDENNVILSGHTRLKALQELGYTETECIRYTGLTEDRKKIYRLLANKVGEVATWDVDLLNMELEDLPDFDAEFYDFELAVDEENSQLQDVEYKERISVVIDCEDEADAERVFDELISEGYKCRISTL